MILKIEGKLVKSTLEEIVVSPNKPLKYCGKRELSWTTQIDEPTHKLLLQWINQEQKKKTLNLIKRLAARAIVRSCLYS